MTRFHHTPAGLVPFSSQEEAEWNAREASEVLANALALFKAKRDLIVSLGVMHAGQRWHTDAMSQHAYSSAIRLGEAAEAATGDPWETQWKTMTGYVAVGIAQLVAAGLVVGAFVQAAFAREAELIEQASGGDIEGAVAALSTGWPEPGA